MHVVLQRSTSTGRQLDHGAALLGANGQLHTASSAIDEADRIQAHAASGDPRPISSVVAWSRLGRWAVLASGLPAPGTKVNPADATQTRVGDRCYALDGSVTGARVLLDGAVSGRTAGARPAWVVGFQHGDARPGSPVVNESGELLGIIDGPTDTFELLRARRDLRGSPILPFGDIKVPDQAAAVALDDLRGRGELILPVLGDAHVVSGGFAASINRGPIVAPSDQRSEFSTMEKTVTVFVTWSPNERLRGVMTLKLFDANNRPIFQSPPKKSDLRKQNRLLTSWQLTMLRTPGVYRADVMLENRVMWRGYVRLTS